MKSKLIILAIILRLLTPIETAIANARLWYIREQKKREQPNGKPKQ